MKKIKLGLSFLVILLFGVLLVACETTPSDDNGDDEEITITLNKTTVELSQGEEFTLVATVTGSTEAVVWSSSNSRIATVEAGKVTGLTQGTVNITAKVGEKTAIATVTVSAEPFPVLTLSQETIELIVNGNGITVVPEVRYDGKVVTAEFTWEVKDPSVAKVTNGLIEPLAIGETEVLVSTTYKGDFVQKAITVIVNIDASVLLSKSNVVLDIADVDGTQNIMEAITVKAFVSGVELTEQVFDFELDEDVVEYVVEGNTITITPLLAGEGKLTVSFVTGGTKVFSVINISVNKVVSVIEKAIYVDLSQTGNQVLNFESLGITENVLSVTSNNQVVSSVGDVSILSSAWLATVSTGDLRDIKIETENITYVAKIKFAVSYINIEFDLTAENTVGATYAYSTEDKTFKYMTGIDTNWWNNRLESTTALIKDYDYIVFDFLSKDNITGSMAFWMDMALGDVNTTTMDANGTRSREDVIYIFDTQGDLVSGALVKDVKYTFVIKLGHGDPEGRYAFGINQDTTIMLSNQIAASADYVDNNFNFPEKVETEFIVSFDLTDDNTVGATLVYSPNDNAFQYTTSAADAWSNRLQSTESQIKNYDYLLFDFMPTELITGDITFWMDMAKPNVNTTVLKPDGTRLFNQDRIYIFNSLKELVTGSLNAGEIYTIVIRLGHEDPDGQYAFGINQDTIVWIRNPLAVQSAFVEANYNIDTPPVEEPLEDTFDVTFGLTSENVDGTYSFNEEKDAFEFVSGSNAWGNRLQSSQLAILSYDYMVFDLMLTETLVGQTHFWMDMSSVTSMNADGSKTTTGLIFILNDQGQLVTGPLDINVYYTFVIKLGHAPKENRYAFNFTQNTTAYVKNAFAATTSYVDNNFTLIPEVEEPLEDTFDVTFDLTADNNVGASFDFVPGANAFEYKTGAATNAWANRIEASNPELKSYDYIVFNIALTAGLTDKITFWMDMTPGDAGVFFLGADGVSSPEGRLFIFNESGEPVTGPLATYPTQYKFVIKLVQGAEDRFALGFEETTMVYIQKSYAATAEYVETTFGIPIS